MALTDYFTGAPMVRAAEQQRQFLGNLMGNENWNLGRVETQGLGTLADAQGNMLGTLGPAYAQAQGIIGGATPQQIGTIQDYGTGAINAYTGGVGAGAGALGQGLGAWDPVTGLSGNYGTMGQSYASTLMDALGLNGPEGVTRAQNAFTTTPGYQFNLEQGLNAIDRARNMSGQLVGGNTDRAAQEFGAGLASQQWNQYIDNLRAGQGLFAPLALQGATAGAQGQSGLYTSLANLFSQGGQGVANLLSGMGSNISNIIGGGARSLADLVTGGAGALSNVFGNTASQQTNLLQGLAGTGATFNAAMAQPYGSTYSNAANAQMQGSANTVGLISQIVRALGGTMWGGGPFGGGGSSGSSLGNLNALSSPTSLSNFSTYGPAGSFNFAL